ncbi:MAG: type II secretion system F family protein [Nocardioides sp.]
MTAAMPPVPTSLVVAAACAAASAYLLLPSGRTADRTWSRRGTLVTAAVVALAILRALPPQTVVLLALVAATLVAAARLWRARASRLAARAVGGRVLETCERLAGELAAGRPPGSALDAASRSWAPLAPAAEAFRVGADVPAALRALADRPGAGDLRLVAAAWQVAHRTGEGLGAAVDRVAGQLRAAASTHRVVDGELASARATARLVAGLPLLSLAMGSGAGGDPWGFLLGSPVGLACLAGGLLLGLAGLAWIEVIARDVDRAT